MVRYDRGRIHLGAFDQTALSFAPHVMKLLLLGTTGYHPSDTRQTACMMLPECGVVLDAGTAMYRVREYLDHPTLDIFLSHTHLDHVIGLTFLFDVLFEKQVDRVRVHGEAGKLAALREHLFSESLFPAQPPIEWHPLAGPVPLPHQGELTYFPLNHPGGSLGYRFDWPQRSLAYVTDTTAKDDAAYVEKIRGVDVLIHECYFPDGWEDRAELTGHSCISPVARVARDAHVGLLILVHINPLAETDDAIGLDKARDIFENTYIGTDFMEVDF
jgi:ribonuclease Z